MDKLKAEAGLVESKVILGWNFDFRRLIISLPENKIVTWTTNVRHLLLNEATTTAKELESTISHLGHLTLVVPGVQTAKPMAYFEVDE